MNSNYYDSYPVWIVFAANLLALTVYALGAYIISGFGLAYAAAYLVYCIVIELNVLRKSCVNCVYYGKLCGTGKGVLCALLLPNGNTSKFAEKKVSFTDMLPDFMVSLFPVIGGAVLLTKNFDWMLAGATAGMLALSFAGNALIRGQLLCKYCKQRRIGCPAEKLFSQGKK